MVKGGLALIALNTHLPLSKLLAIDRLTLNSIMFYHKNLICLTSKTTFNKNIVTETIIPATEEKERTKVDLFYIYLSLNVYI